MSDTSRRKKEKTTNQLLENLSAQSRKRERKVADVMAGDVGTANTDKHPNQTDPDPLFDPVKQVPAGEKPSVRLGRPSLGVLKEKLTVALLPEIKEQIKLQAVMHHTTPGHIIEQAVTAWLATQDKN